MQRYERRVRFDEVDAAGIVFFGQFARYAHEAMEEFFAPLEGGYSTLIQTRRVGLPAVDFHIRYMSPLRYGESFEVETDVVRLGNRSAVLGYRFLQAGRICAEAEHTVVTTDLDGMASCDMPADVRQLLAAHQRDPDQHGPDQHDPNGS